MTAEPLIPQHGGYRNLKSFQIAQLVYDVTVAFCDAHVERRSRTHDQMVQAARSGVQNIAEGSKASGTSRNSEMRLTNVARASMEELRLDYEDYLRQRGLLLWPPEHPALMRFKARRCAVLRDVQGWLREELAALEMQSRVPPDQNRDRTPEGNTDQHQSTQTGARPRTQSMPATHHPSEPVRVSRCESVSVRGSPCDAAPSAQLEANAALSLLNLCCYLLTRQLESHAAAFERDGGFTERLYGRRRAARDG